MFCECGGLLISEDGKLVCSSCGKVYEDKELTLSTKQKAEKKILKSGKEKKNPIVKKTCPKCGYDKCEFWVVQTRASDEAPTRFYRCLKCGYTWREYS